MMEKIPGELPIPDREHENYTIADLRKENNIPLVFDIEAGDDGKYYVLLSEGNKMTPQEYKERMEMFAEKEEYGKGRN